MYFLFYRIFEQLALALQTEFALKFFRPEGAAALPTPRLVRLWMWDYVDERVKFVAHFNLWTKFKSICTRKERKCIKFCSFTIESCLLWHILHKFCFILKKYDLLQSFFKCGSGVIHTFLTKQWCKALKRGHGSERERTKATPSLSLPSIHPWAHNLSCWRSACDQNETKFEIFPIRVSNSADKLLYFQEACDLYKFNCVQC